jgi:DNA-binding NarL/FixJ family response regulator
MLFSRKVATDSPVQPPFRTLIISSDTAMRQSIHGCLQTFKDFSLLADCCNGMTGLKAIANLQPDLVFVVAPLPDRVLGHLIKDAKRKHPAIRIVVVANWTEFAGFARANHKGADGFVSERLLSRELPLILAQYPQLAATWGTRFSPWKTGYGMA